MRRKIVRQSGGFTLLETLVAISAIATVGILITQVFFTTTRSNTKAELLKDVKQNGDYAMEIMSRTIRNSVAVISDCAATGTALDALELENFDGNNTQFSCFFDGKETRIASTSATTGSSEYLTSSNVTLGGASCDDTANTLKFTCTSYADQPPKITIQFQLAQSTIASGQFEQANISFQTTVSPRN